MERPMIIQAKNQKMTRNPRTEKPAKREALSRVLKAAASRMVTVAKVSKAKSELVIKQETAIPIRPIQTPESQAKWGTIPAAKKAISPEIPLPMTLAAMAVLI